MTELERSKERIEKLKVFRRKRIEIAKSIMMYCENFVMAEEQLLTETNKEKKREFAQNQIDGIPFINNAFCTVQREF